MSSPKEIILRADPIIHLSGMNNVIKSKLERLGYRADVLSTEPELVVRMRAAELAKKFPWVNLILFLVTLLFTILAGALQEGIDFVDKPSLLIDHPLGVLMVGLPFSFSLLAILLFHEFGHYTAARIHRVDVTLPYFIPAPTLLGTFGAFIKSKSAFMNKRELLDVAAAGPLAGLVISIIVLIIGINGSSLVPVHSQDGNLMIFGNSLLYKFLVYILKGPIPAGQVLPPNANSIMFAGWVGLLVTMFNLLPIGQLDGGHIMYALFGKYQKGLAYLAMLGLLILSFWWTGWAIWLFIALLLRPGHPPTVMDDVPIEPWRRYVGYLSILAFILCFMPVPIWYS